MQLEFGKTQPSSTATKDSLSVPRAEIISRVWQAVAYIEETRSDLNRLVRQSPGRDQAIGALQMATSHLVAGAGLLTPREYAAKPKARKPRLQAVKAHA